MSKTLTNSRQFVTSAGAFDLRRYPSRKEEPLKAWNSADVLLVEQMLELEAIPGSLLTVNDEHGALALALRPAAQWTDSALSMIAVKENCRRNNIEAPKTFTSVESPSGSFSAVAMKVPKQLSYFEFQLSQLCTIMPVNTVLVASGMDKHLSPQVAGLIEKYIGPTTRHRGKFKARCFCAARDERSPGDTPISWQSYYSEILQGEMRSLANVFSREKMDGGSRLLIEVVTSLEPAKHAIDLACGNGVLGLTLYKLGLCKSLTLCDESAMAVDSASHNALNLMRNDIDNINTHHGDGLLNIPGPRAELIVCNPPFHSNHTVEEYVGKRLLAQCANHLQHSGRLCLVANRHLNYLPTLKKGFSRVDKLSDNGKFIVWLAKK